MMRRLMMLPLAVGLFLLPFSPVGAAKKENIQNEILYTILVDRYNNGDQSQTEQVNLDDPKTYHGGDLQGITDKLDNLKKLGFTTLVLSPIMENASNGYHGYWIENFTKVEEQFGTMKDLKKLVSEAHERDMKIVLEFVPNYVAKSHRFVDDSDKQGWFKQNEVKDYRWLENVSVLDQTNPEVQQHITDAADFWIEQANIDGYLLHAADQSNKAFLEQLAAHIREQNPDVYMLAETLDENAAIDELEAIKGIQAVEHNNVFEPMTAKLAMPDESLNSVVETLSQHKENSGLHYLDRKDTERFSQKLLENGRNPLTTWKLALTFLYTAPGTPVIYQGSEIPMSGKGFPETQQLVRFNSGEKELKEFFERISALKEQFPALRHGDYELVDSSGAMSLLKRSYEGDTVYIAINNDVTSQAVSIDNVGSGKQLKGLLGDNLVRENEDGKFKVGLERESAEVYVMEKDTGFNWTFIGVILGIFSVFAVAVFLLTRKQKKREADL